MHTNLTATGPASDHSETVALKTLVIVSGKKGGVGKSIVAATVYEYLLPHHGETIALYDLDGADGDLCVRYKDSAIPLNPRRIDDFGAIIDDLMDPTSPTSLAVVDVGAPAGALIDAFLIEGGPADAAAAGNLKIVMLWVVGGTPRSMTYLDESLTAWEDVDLRHMIDLTIVANHGQGARFDFIEASSAADRIPVVHFPRLEEEAAQEVTNLKLGFSAYTALGRAGQHRPSFSRQSMVNRWLGRTAQTFDAIPALAALTQPASPAPLLSDIPPPATTRPAAPVHAVNAPAPLTIAPPPAPHQVHAHISSQIYSQEHTQTVNQSVPTPASMPASMPAVSSDNSAAVDDHLVYADEHIPVDATPRTAAPATAPSAPIPSPTAPSHVVAPAYPLTADPQTPAPAAPQATNTGVTPNPGAYLRPPHPAEAAPLIPHPQPQTQVQSPDAAAWANSFSAMTPASTLATQPPATPA